MGKYYVKIGCYSFLIMLFCVVFAYFYPANTGGKEAHRVSAYFFPALSVSKTPCRFQDILFPAITGKEHESEEPAWDKVAIRTDYVDTFAEESGAVNDSENALDDTGEMHPASATDAVSETLSEDTIPLLPAQGITYSMEQLTNREFLIENCYTIDSSTMVTEEELDAESLLSEDLHIDNHTQEPKILIYHTHGSETFADSRPGVIEDTVIGLGDELTRILQEDYGIPVYHDRTVYDVIDGVEDRSRAYDLASDGVDAILQQYPSIEVVLDIHRDGVREDVRLVREIDGISTAQIMFLNGVSRTKENGDMDYLYNPYKKDNLAFSLQMHLAGKEMYGDLMRRIYVRGYCFNLNRMARSSLVEVGAQTNTVAEAKHAMVPLGAILYKVLIAQE